MEQHKDFTVDEPTPRGSAMLKQNLLTVRHRQLPTPPTSEYRGDDARRQRKTHYVETDSDDIEMPVLSSQHRHSDIPTRSRGLSAGPRGETSINGARTWGSVGN